MAKANIAHVARADGYVVGAALRVGKQSWAALDTTEKGLKPAKLIGYYRSRRNAVAAVRREAGSR